MNQICMWTVKSSSTAMHWKPTIFESKLLDVVYVLVHCTKIELNWLGNKNSQLEKKKKKTKQKTMKYNDYLPGWLNACSPLIYFIIMKCASKCSLPWQKTTTKLMYEQCDALFKCDALLQSIHLFVCFRRNRSNEKQLWRNDFWFSAAFVGVFDVRDVCLCAVLVFIFNRISMIRKHTKI